MTISEAEADRLRGYVRCKAETSDGSGSVWCELPNNHDGDCWDGLVRWRYETPDEVEPVLIVDVAKWPLLRDASRCVLYRRGMEVRRVMGTSSCPKWGMP